MEALDRGFVAVRTGQGVFLSWRMLGTDAESIAFNLYRDGSLVNGTPILDTTSFLDSGGTASSVYTLRAIVDAREQPAENAGAVWQQPYKTVQLNRPGTQYSPNDLSVGDLDGDGDYELIVKWDPDNAKDNAHSGLTDNVFIDAYTLEGQRLWRIDLGRNIRAGAHYTQFLVYDFDGDGKAEVVMKTGDGTRDGTGAVIGNANADHRNAEGYILSGPEFLTVFNGGTGAAMATVAYEPARGTLSAWGDTYGNRVDRFLAGVAYLDGKRPSIIMSRGYYAKAMIVAWDWRDGQLRRRWTFTADDSQNQSFRGQGAHSLSVADVDADGRDEIIFGAATIDDNGRGLYSTGLGHGDALHVSDMDPARPGLEVFMVHESPGSYGDYGLSMHDARTGQILHGQSGENTDIGRGLAADIDPRHSGMESWGSRGGLVSATGQIISGAKPGSMNFAVWWDGDLLRELLNGTTIDKWDYSRGTLARMLTASDYGAASNNGTKSTPGLSADILGDWREEVIWRHSDNDKLLIFTTTVPTLHRLRTLMHDSQYRVAVAWQNVAYNQPPHPGYFLGDGMNPQPVPQIYYPAVQDYPTGQGPAATGLRIEEGLRGFCSVDGVIESNNGGYTGAGYANSDNVAGAGVSWSVDAAEAGIYQATIRYASISDRPAQLTINGVGSNGLNFTATGTWTAWQVETAALQLQNGINMLRLTGTSNEGLANIDYLEIDSAGTSLSIGSCL